MSEDLAPGTEIEMYRGREAAPFVHGARFIVGRVHDGAEYEPCPDCLPGYVAPAIELAGIPRFLIEKHGPQCACIFRPVRRGQSEQSNATSAPADREREGA
jgi:hypothetical protein